MSDEIHRTLGRIEEKIDGLDRAIKQHFEDDKVNFGSIKKDVAAIQKKMWFGSGFAAACGAVFGIFIKGHN